GLAVVEALIGKFESFRREPLELGAGRIERGEAVAKGEEKAAALAQRERAWRLGKRPLRDLARARLIAPQRWAGDVDPPENLLASAPQRALAEHVPAFDDAPRVVCRQSSSGVGYAVSDEWRPRPASRERAPVGFAGQRRSGLATLSSKKRRP